MHLPSRALASLLAISLLLTLDSARALGAPEGLAPVHWPPGTEVLEFENLEGVILVRGTLRGMDSRDTTGSFALDTGAGFLAVGHRLAQHLGLADTLADPVSVQFVARPLPRLELGALQLDQLWPVLSVDMDVVQRVTDRPVLGLLGERLFSNHALLIDYRRGSAARIPVTPTPRDPRVPGGGEAAGEIDRSRRDLRTVLTPAAIAVPFEPAGDGKLIVAVRVANPRPPRFSEWLNFILDTGATKCVAFEDALTRHAPRAGQWPTLRGLAVPTLIGTSESRMVRIPALRIRTDGRDLEVRGIDCAVMRSEISEVLSRAVSRPVHGLLGYSFLKHYRVTIDYPRHVVWLDPEDADWDERPYEYSHVGLQLERGDGAVRVLAVADRSPAAQAGIVAGDEVVEIDGRPLVGSDIASITRMLEGRPGTRLRLTIRHGGRVSDHRLVRRRLL